MLRKEPKIYKKGFIDRTATYLLEGTKIKFNSFGKNNAKLLGIIAGYGQYNDRSIEYKRRKIGLLDLISRIGALFGTIKFFFAFVFKYYSKNFDNYKMIEKILSEEKIINSTKNNKKKFIELIPNLYNSNSSINIEKEMVNMDDDKNQIFPLKNDFVNEKNIYSDVNYDNYDNKLNQINQIFDNNHKKKICFIHFLINALYCKCCHKYKNQEILHISKEIVSKYLSIDYILYNQIIFEKLLEDYRWNNPDLKNLENNELIIKFKNLLS